MDLKEQTDTDIVQWLRSFSNQMMGHKDLAGTRLRASADLIEQLRKRIDLMSEVVREACNVVDADTYKHPILSREDAVKAGVIGLLESVERYRSATAVAAVEARALLGETQ